MPRRSGFLISQDWSGLTLFRVLHRAAWLAWPAALQWSGSGSLQSRNSSKVNALAQAQQSVHHSLVSAWLVPCPQSIRNKVSRTSQVEVVIAPSTNLNLSLMAGPIHRLISGLINSFLLRMSRPNSCYLDNISQWCQHRVLMSLYQPGPLIGHHRASDGPLPALWLVRMSRGSRRFD